MDLKVLQIYLLFTRRLQAKANLLKLEKRFKLIQHKVKVGTFFLLMLIVPQTVYYLVQ